MEISKVLSNFARASHLYLTLVSMTNDTNLHEPLKQYFGFDTFRNNQETIIRNLMAGQDVFVLMPTGGGKSICYQLPALLMEGVAIVVSPLIALMKNQVDAVRQTRADNSVAHYIYAALTKNEILGIMNDVASGKTKLLYVSPELFNKESFVEFLKTVQVSFIAVDEAHCISEWGHDFRPEYRKLRPIINEIGSVPIIALTATATDKVRIDIKKNLGIPDALEFKSSFNRPNLYYEVRQKTAKVDYDVIKFIKSHPHVSGIIYCLSRKRVEELTEVLRTNDIKAAAYHAGLDAQLRSDTQDAFLKEDIDVIVATIAFGWASTNPMCASSSTTTFPKALKDITKKPDALAVMAARASALPSILIKISKNWRNLWKVNPLANKTLVVNSLKRRPLMPSLLCADVSCSFITLENNMKAPKAAAIVTIVNTLINKWKEKIIYVELSRLFLNARKTSPMTTLKTY